MEKIKAYFLILIILCPLLAIKENQYNIPTGEKYIIGEDGIKRIYINIWGHIKNPGTYLVYEDIDLMTLLSMAGGPLDGANLSKIEIINKDSGDSDIINLKDGELIGNIKFSPYDTISISPSSKFYLRQNAYLINVLLQIITLGLTLSN